MPLPSLGVTVAVSRTGAVNVLLTGAAVSTVTVGIFETVTVAWSDELR